MDKAELLRALRASGLFLGIIISALWALVSVHLTDKHEQHLTDKHEQHLTDKHEQHLADKHEQHLTDKHEQR